MTHHYSNYTGSGKTNPLNEERIRRLQNGDPPPPWWVMLIITIVVPIVLIITVMILNQ